ncbi:MAG: hypothetical protein LBG08_01150 [Spirochaetaceae bacterium]|jgi:hypothetical protein|nr:hypothetical protein [Spirochaetaceae bacterium]
MLKKSLMFVSVLLILGALLLTGCSNPTAGATGAPGPAAPGSNTGGNGNNTGSTGGSVTQLSGPTVTADALKGAFVTFDRVELYDASAQTVTGLVPTGKTLAIKNANGVSIANGESLEVLGTLEIVEGALDASYTSSVGYLKGSGTITGTGALALPYLSGSGSLPAGGIHYKSADFPDGKVAAGSLVTAAATAAGSAISATEIATILGSESALAVYNATGLIVASVPSGKELTLTGAENTIAVAFTGAATTGTINVAPGAVLTVSANVDLTNGGTLNVPADATLKVSGTSTITDIAAAPKKIAIGGTIELASGAALTLANAVSLATATVDATAGAATLTLPTGDTTIGAIVLNTADLTIATATGLTVSSFTSEGGGIKSASVTKYYAGANYVELGSAGDSFVVTGIANNVFMLKDGTITAGPIALSGVRLKTNTTGITVSPTNLPVTTLDKFETGSKITYSDAITTGVSGPLPIPAGITVALEAGSTLESITGLTVNGVLDIGANTALTLAGITAGTVTTTSPGKIVSTTTTPAVLSALLSKAGAALNIEQGGSVTLDGETTVKAGTTLTLTNGDLTVESDSGSNKALTVAGAVILDASSGAPSIKTAGNDVTEPDITITGGGSITAGGIVISGAGGINTNKAVTLTEDDLSLTTSSTIVITNSAQIQAGGTNGILFKAGKYAFGAGETANVLTISDAKPTLTLSGTAPGLEIGNDTASELVFGSNSIYVVADNVGSITPGTTASVNTDVKLTFKPGAQVKSGTGASASTAGPALVAAGTANANDTIYTVGGSGDVTVTKSASASVWSAAVTW